MEKAPDDEIMRNMESIMTRLAKGFTDIDVELLVKADWNYKQDDEYKKSKLINNFEANGQVENIIIRDLDDGTYEIVNGNHRYDVMVEVGLSKCHVYNLGIISKAQAMRIALETNETRFLSDDEKLAVTIDELLEAYDITDLSSTLPWTEDEIESMKSTLDDYIPDERQELSEDAGSNDGRVVYIISVDVCDDAIEQELQNICDTYDSAVMRVK